jgi:hypothetical protein
MTIEKTTIQDLVIIPEFFEDSRFFSKLTTKLNFVKMGLIINLWTISLSQNEE